MDEQLTKLINLFFENSILVSPEIIEKLKLLNKEGLESIFSYLSQNKDAAVIDEALITILKSQKGTSFSWKDLDRAKANLEKQKDTKTHKNFIEAIEKETPTQKEDVIVINPSIPKSKKREVQDFVKYFNKRFEALSALLKNRREIQNPLSISRIIAKRDKEHISIIGMVKEIQTTKNGNLVIVLEDQTGQIKTLVNKNKPELFQKAKDTVPDEVVGVVGVNGDNIVFVNDLISPDVPVNKELKKYHEEAYAIFLSDIHVGSNNFLAEEFSKFISWING